MNSIDLRHATHQEAVNALLSNTQELTMLVRRDPPPPGMQVGSEQETWGVVLSFVEESLLKAVCIWLEVWG